MKKVFLATLLLGVSLAANAQQDASQTWEWSIGVLYQDSKNLSSDGGSSLDVDSAVGLGFNLGYNLTDHFNVGFDFDFLRPDYTAVLVDDSIPPETTQIDYQMYQFNGRFKANYNFLEGPFRPFVEAGIGWSYFDSNVASGPPLVGCWWDPWWGYICDGFYNTYSDTSFTYGVGVGFKYRFIGNSFLKLGINQWWLDGVGASGNEDLTGARLEYGWSF